MQIERGPGRGLSQPPPQAGLGREAAQTLRFPVLPPQKKTLLTALELAHLTDEALCGSRELWGSTRGWCPRGWYPGPLARQYSDALNSLSSTYIFRARGRQGKMRHSRNALCATRLCNGLTQVYFPGSVWDFCFVLET